MSAAPHLIPVEPPRRRCHACGLWHCECDEREDCAAGECEVCDVEGDAELAYVDPLDMEELSR